MGAEIRRNQKGPGGLVLLITSQWKTSTSNCYFAPEAEAVRKTKETDIKIVLKLDGTGTSAVNTGLGFFDHMLDQLARMSARSRCERER